MARQVNFNGYLLRQFGSYIRTDLSALVEVNGVATGIIGITGLAEKGPTNTATTITSYTQLVNTFGDGPLVRHGLAAYVGGANTLVAVRLDDEDSNPASYASSTTFITSSDGYSFTAIEKGTYGNNISVRVTAPQFLDDSYLSTSDGTVVSTDATYYDNGVYIPEDLVSETDLVTGTYAVVEDWDSSNATPYQSGSSYSIFQWIGSKWSVVNTEEVRSVISVKYGGLEEELLVPYFINETEWVKALAATEATDRYYVLKNVITNQVREIPSNWLDGEISTGSLSYEDFESIVDDLKSDDEVIYSGTTGTTSANYTISLNTPTKFPFELIEHIINYGGFGTGSSSLINISTYIESAENASTLNPGIVSQGSTLLSGGSNSSDGTGWVSTEHSNAGNFTSGPGSPSASWENAFAVFENEEVNFIQPSYFFGSNSGFDAKYSFFKSLAAKILLHVNLMSNTPNRKFRTSILGLPSGQDGAGHISAASYLNQTRNITGTLNSDRIQLWAGGFYSTALETVSTEKLYGAEWVASFAAGSHAAREVSVSLTFAQMAGIFTGGMEYQWTTAQKDELYGRSLAFILKRRTSTGATEYVAAHNYTSFTGAPSKGIQLFITRRIVDYMNTFVYKNLEENFIGRKSRGAETAARIQGFVESLLRSLITDDILVAFEQLNVYADENDKTVYYVDYAFQPVTEIDFILTTNRLVYNLA